MLTLLPNSLNPDGKLDEWQLVQMKHVVSRLDGIIAETAKAGRRFAGQFSLSHRRSVRDLPIVEMGKRADESEIDIILSRIKNGERWGLVSDAGIACIADPGCEIVKKAYVYGVDVQTLVGPCSIVLALQLSGFSGQKFTFHGYLEREGARLAKQIGRLDKEEGTHIFIETPYRNDKMLSALLANLSPTTKLCVAMGLTTREQNVISKRVSEWRGSLPKIPAIFLISR